VTAYPQHAVEAFAGGAVHYLLKPISRVGVAQALSRVRPKDDPLQQAWLRIPVRRRSGTRLLRPAEVEALVPAAEAAMGQVDILVANAGITRDNLFVQLRDEDWDEVIKVNLTATFRLARAATKLMMRKRFGRIIAITSIVGVTGNPGQGNYTASKAGLIGMIKTLGAEYAKRNVTANCIAPGFIKTPMTDALNDKQRETILSKVPAARLGTPEDIAAAAIYLASNEAAYVTGQTIHVNGGMAMF